MSESEKIKKMRKEKFLQKMNNQNNNNNSKANDIPMINNCTPIPDEDNSSPETSSKNKPETEINNSQNKEDKQNYNENNIIEDNSINNQANMEINLEEEWKNINKSENVKIIIKIIKKFFVIIISFLHYYNFRYLDKVNLFKYALLFIEINTLLIYKYLEHNIIIRINSLKKYNKDLNSAILPINQNFYLLKIIDIFSARGWRYLNYLVVAYNVIFDVIVDLAIICVINFIFFIIYEED